MKDVVVMMDGGHVRACARQARLDYGPALIEHLAQAAIAPDEAALRFLYYDCRPFQGRVRLPISGEEREFRASDRWLDALAVKDLFAVRLGELKLRGFERRNPTATPAVLTDDDFRPVFEQKGVDMRIGLDIATYASGRLAQRIILMTGDADCIPAMKHARKAGLQVVLVELPKGRLVSTLRQHADYVRGLDWPA